MAKKQSKTEVVRDNPAARWAVYHMNRGDLDAAIKAMRGVNKVLADDLAKRLDAIREDIRRVS